eukprot:TRINITY_DN22008_c0_g1_i4.p1 TRINITY_DN22008_c0_g1~~TRINITY_DN22008_c0_g1_i4.p1  ORF type:complete len:225 (+),score=22.30 TRINITY_DN22008_c0_g1_i4:55-675(+)
MSGKYDLMMKCIIVGDSDTGKSCILHRFTQGKFVEDLTHTIGVEFGAKIVDVMGKTVKLQIWDTAGQERYRSVTRSYYRGASACLIVFDITCKESFVSVTQWIQDARVLAGPDIVVVLVGNKSDLGEGDARKVSTTEALQMAQANGLLYFETSAVTGEHIEDAFLKIAKTVLMRSQSSGATSQPKSNNETLDLPRESKPRKKKCCS